MGLLRTAGRVAVATRVHGSVQRRQRDRWAQQDAAQQQAAATMAPSTPPPAPPAAQGSVPAPQPQTSSTADMLGLLAQLGSLRDSGVLTPEEFEAQKADVLAKARQG